VIKERERESDCGILFLFPSIYFQSCNEVVTGWLFISKGVTLVGQGGSLLFELEQNSKFS